MRSVRIALATVAFGATLAGAPAVTSAAPFPTASTAIRPDRVLDTRHGVGASAGTVDPGERLTLSVPAAANAGASSVVLNLTAADAAAPGYVTAWPCADPRPATSVLNFTPDHATPNLIALKLPAGGLCFETSASVHLIGDVMGWFTGNGDFRGSSPNRLVDTRDESAPLAAGVERRVTVAGTPGIGGSAAAVAMNVTVTQPTADGYVVAYPCGTSPDASTVNFRRGEDVANLTFVALSGDDVCVRSSVTTHLILDTFGWSNGSGELRALPPARVLDTRQVGQWPYGPAQSTSTITLHVAGRGGVPKNAAAALVTITAVDGAGDGYVTVWPCDEEMPGTSTLNLWHNVVRSNLAMVDLAESDGTVCLQATTLNHSPIHLVVDAVGWTTGGPSRADPPAVPPAPSEPTTPTTPAPTSPSHPTGHFSTLPPGTPLPSDSECAGRVRRGVPEKRPGNTPYNQTTWHTEPGLNDSWSERATGNFTGTTDEIMQWVACKWGIDEDIVRAQAVRESYWEQTAGGDYTGDSNSCHPSVRGQSPCPESLGILQVRYNYHEPAMNGSIASTAYNLDYAYARWRACYEGTLDWLNQFERGGTYSGGDEWGCVGVWFAGRWRTADANWYIGEVQNVLQDRTWEDPNF